MLGLPNRMLVVVAHPDDEVLGCGGLISRCTSDGGRCQILILTEGATTQYPDQPELVRQKLEEARAASAILGAEGVSVAELPDMQLSTLPIAEVVAPISSAIESFDPDWIVTHHHGDLNSDHRVTHEACRVAARPDGTTARALLAMEVPSSTEYGYEPLRASLAVRLSDEDLARKQEALAAYASEARDYPHGRSAEALGALANYRGYTTRNHLSEVFELIWGQIP